MNLRAMSLLVLTLAALIGCGSSDPGKVAKNGGNGKTSGEKRFIFLTNGDDPFWDTCRAGWVEMAKELKLEEAGIVADYQ